jgi:hypothetical protein
MTDHNASGCGTDQHVRQCDRVYKRPSGRPGVPARRTSVAA